MPTIPIDDVVRSTVTVGDRVPTLRDFTTPMIVGYHTLQTNPAERVLTFSTPEEVAQSFPSGHPIRVQADALFSRSLGRRVRRIKVGRRLGAPLRTMRYTPVTLTPGFVYRGTIAGVAWSYTLPSTPTPTVENVIDGIVAAVNALPALMGSTAGLLAATPTSASLQTLVPVPGSAGASEISPPARIVITRSTHVDHDAVTGTLTYVDDLGVTRVESPAFTNGGGDTYTTTRPARRFTSLAIPAQGGTGGTTSVGTAPVIALADNATSFDVASTVAGAGVTHQVGALVRAADLALEDTTPNPATSIATDLDGILAADGDWIAMVIADGHGIAQQSAAAAWAETAQRLYGIDTADTAVGTASTLDIGSAIAAASYEMSFVLYHRGGDGYAPWGRLFGAMLPFDPGGEAWANRTLAGLPADDLTSTERTQMKAKNVTYYGALAEVGFIVTQGRNGGVRSGLGRFIDLVRYRLYIESQLRAALVRPLIDATPGLPFDDVGITLQAGRVRSVLSAQETRRVLRSVELKVPTVDITDDPTALVVSETDRANRTLAAFEWSAIYIGPQHAAEINGRLSV